MNKFSYTMNLEPHDDGLWLEEERRETITHKKYDQSGSAARIIGLGFRAWVRGLQSHDCRFFDVCQRNYIDRFGFKDGMVLSTKLGNWVSALDQMKNRPFSIYGPSAEGFSFDEVVAISMIAACQHSQCPALKACLFAITETSDLNLPEYAARDFAEGLIDAGEILSDEFITLPLAIMAASGGPTPPTDYVI